MDNINNDKLNQELKKELVNLQERFKQSENLANIGKLSAGILHEIRNPLNFVSNFAKLSQDLLVELSDVTGDIKVMSDDDKADIVDISTMLADNLTKIIENADRSQRIISSILAQTRSDYSLELELTDINQLVEEFVKLAYQGVRGNDKDFNMSLLFDFDEEVGQQMVSQHELSRVILNIVNNACYALKERGRQDVNFKPAVSVKTQLESTSFLIVIEDNGIGMPQAVIDKLFTPFFTTKPVGQGTGLGLSLCKEIIEEVHKGSIQIESKENLYTKFIIRIPQKV